MNAKKVSHASMSKLQKMLLAVLVIIVCFGSLPTGKAHAWTYTEAVGKPGSWFVPTVYVTEIPLPNVNSLFLHSNTTRPYVFRSPASTSDQRVLALYTLEKWNGSRWVTFSQSAVFSGVIRSNQSYIFFPALTLQPSSPPAGSYRVFWSFVWGTTTGIQLGAINIIPNRAGDHICQNTLRLCQPYAGYFEIR